MSQPIEIRIRRASGDGYAASGGGQRATCSWSPMEAARRVAAKLVETPYRLVKVDEQPGDHDAGVLYRFRAEQLCETGMDPRELDDDGSVADPESYEANGDPL